MKKMLKRITAVVLTIIMLLTTAPLTGLTDFLRAIAADPVPDGYTGVYTAAQLYTMCQGKTGNYILMKDIDISSYTNWCPMSSGNANAKFTGTFDGNKHTISGLTINDSNNPDIKYYGLFGYGSFDETIIKNLTLDDVYIYVKSNLSVYVGCLFGDSGDSYCKNEFNSCEINGKVTVVSNNQTVYVGGLSAYSYYSFKPSNIKTNLDINVYNAKTTYVGTALGYFSGRYDQNYLIERMETKGKISVRSLNGNVYAGGCCGYINTNSDISFKRCYNQVDISAESSSNSQLSNTLFVKLGGIVGAVLASLHNTSVSYCSNSGNIICNDQSVDVKIGLGGIAGDLSHYLGSTYLGYCYNSGTIYTKSIKSSDSFCNIAGLLGQTSAEGYCGHTLEKSFNCGDVIAKGFDRLNISGCLASYTAYGMTINQLLNYGLIRFSDFNRCISCSNVTGSREEYNCYGLSEEYFHNASEVNNSRDKTTQLTKEAFKDRTNFTNFDFNTVWKYNDTNNRLFPVLKSVPFRFATLKAGLLLSGNLGDLDEITIPVKNQLSNAVPGATVTIKLGEQVVLEKTTDANGNAVFPVNELLQSGFDADNLANNATLTATYTDHDIIASGGDFASKTYYLHDFLIGAEDYIELGTAYCTYNLKVAFDTANGKYTTEYVKSVLDSVQQKYFNLTHGRVVLNFNEIIECSNRVGVATSGADICIYEKYWDQTCANPGGYGKPLLHIATGFEMTKDENTPFGDNVMCHELTHYLFGALDEYASGFAAKNNSYNLSLIPGLLAKQYYVYWIRDRGHGYEPFACSNLPNNTLTQMYYSIWEDFMDKQFHTNLWNDENKTQMNGYLGYSTEYEINLQEIDENGAPVLDDNGNTIYNRIRVGSYNREHGAEFYNDANGIIPNPGGLTRERLGIMWENSNLHFSTSETYDYLLTDEYGNSKVVDESHPEWYTAQYYKHGCSVEELVTQRLEGKLTQSTMAGSIAFSATNDVTESDFAAVKRNLPEPEYSTVAETITQNDDYTMLQNADKSSGELCAVSFGNVNGKLKITAKSGALSSAIVLIKSADSETLKRYNLSFASGTAAVQTNEALSGVESVYVLTGNNGSYSYNEYTPEQFESQNSDYEYNTTFSTVTSDEDYTESYMIMAQEHACVNGEYHSATKPFDLIGISDEGSETVELSQVVPFDEGIDYSSIKAFKITENGFTEIPSSVYNEGKFFKVHMTCDGEGKYVVMAKPAGNTVYAAPTGLQIDADGADYEKELHISFNDSNDPAAIIGYKLFYTTKSTVDKTASDTVCVILPAGQDSYTLFLTGDYAAYNFAVEAIGVDGAKSPLSSTVQFDVAAKDSDGDGLPDNWIALYPTLKDLDDIAGTDSDGDGLTNLEEYQHGTNPLNNDTDCDNVDDYTEIQHGLNPLAESTDGVTKDYEIVYGQTNLTIHNIHFDAENGYFDIENSGSGTAKNVIIQIDAGSDTLLTWVVTIESGEIQRFEFPRSVVKNLDSIIIRADAAEKVSDTDYSDNEATVQLLTANNKYQIVFDEGYSASSLSVFDDVIANKVIKFTAQEDKISYLDSISIKGYSDNGEVNAAGFTLEKTSENEFIIYDLDFTDLFKVEIYDSTGSLVVSLDRTDAVKAYFDANGGTCTVAKKTVYSNETYGALPTPTRDGYSFSGWYTQQEGGTRVTDTTEVTATEDHTLFAHWSIRCFDITLDTDGGTLPRYCYYRRTTGSLFSGPSYRNKGSKRFTYTSAVPLEETNEGSGRYKYWYRNDAYVEVFMDDPYTADMPTDTVYAYYDDVYRLLDTPVKEDCKFLGWFDAQGNQYHNGDSVKITDDITLIAHWYTPETNYITGLDHVMTKQEFESEYVNAEIETAEYVNDILCTGAVVKIHDKQTDEISRKYIIVVNGDVDCDGLRDGRDAVLAECISNGLLNGDNFNHAGIKAADYNADANTDASDVKTLKRLGLMINDCRIYFDNKFDFDSLIVSEGSNITDIYKSFTSDSVSFTTTGTSETYLSISKPTQLIGGHTYRFSYNFESSDNGRPRLTVLTANTAAGNDSQLGYYKDLNDGVTYMEFCQDGQTFTMPENRPFVFLRPGIADANIGTTVTYSDIFIQDITNAYGEADDVNTPEPKTQTVKLGSVFSDFPVMSRAEQTFLGWSTAKDNTGNGVIEDKVTSIKATGDTKLYSIWEKPADRFILNYHPNGGTSGSTVSSTLTCDTAFTIPSSAIPTRIGYTMLGWSTSSSAASPSYAGSATLTAAQVNSLYPGSNGGTRTIYAVWSISNYSISYSLNGGSVSGNPTSYNINTPPFKLNNPTRTGYIFTGWTGSNGSTAQTDVYTSNVLSAALSSYSATSPITLDGRDHIYGSEFAVAPGTTYRVFVTAKRTAGSLDMQGGIWYSERTEGTQYDGFNGSFTYLKDAGNGFGVYYKDITVPAGKQKGQFYIQLSQNESTGYSTTWQAYDGYVVTSPSSNLSYTANWQGVTYTSKVYAGYKTGNGTSYTKGTKGGTAGFSSSCGYRETSYTWTYPNATFTIYAKPAIGYHFRGWYWSSNSSYNSGDTIDNGFAVGDCTLNNGVYSKTVDLTGASLSTGRGYTAKFDPNNYTIVFNSNGGSGSMSNQSVFYGSGTTITANSFTKTGYIFSGWTVGSTSGSSVDDQADTDIYYSTLDSPVNNGTVTLYAKWVETTAA